MLAFMSPGQGNELLPAGPIEIIQAGGINRNDLARAFGLTVTQAHIAGLFGTLKDADAQITRQQSDWQHMVAQACFKELYGKICLCEPCCNEYRFYCLGLSISSKISSAALKTSTGGS